MRTLSSIGICLIPHLAGDRASGVALVALRRVSLDKLRLAVAIVALLPSRLFYSSQRDECHLTGLTRSKRGRYFMDLSQTGPLVGGSRPKPEPAFPRTRIRDPDGETVLRKSFRDHTLDPIYHLPFRLAELCPLSARVGLGPLAIGCA
jgi:hypothetical protein